MIEIPKEPIFSPIQNSMPTQKAARNARISPLGFKEKALLPCMLIRIIPVILVRKPPQKNPVFSFSSFKKHSSQNCGKERRRSNDNSHIRRISIRQCDIFQKEIKSYPCKPCANKIQLLLFITDRQALTVHKQKQKNNH